MTVRLIQGVLLACAIGACSGGSGTQVITGHVDVGKGALAVRAIADDDVVTATPVRRDGSFTLVLPSGPQYRLEVLTSNGVKNVVMRSGNVLRDLSFKVCQPKDPFDIGAMGDPSTDGLCMPGDPNCEPCDPMAGMACGEPPNCGPNDPNCMCDPATGNCTPPCDPMTDPTCGGGCDPSDPNCGTMCQPGDPNCPPPSCDPMTDPNCKCNADGTCPPPPCDPMTDPNCGGGCSAGDPNCCDPTTGMCPPPQCDPADPMCKCSMDPTDPNCGGCYADGTCPPPDCSDPNQPGCTPPCMDPMDPTTCEDPCAKDPAVCGCMANTDDCWGQPEPCVMADGTVNMCDPGNGMEPEHVPGDFGCE